MAVAFKTMKLGGITQGMGIFGECISGLEHCILEGVGDENAAKDSLFFLPTFQKIIIHVYAR